MDGAVVDRTREDRGRASDRRIAVVAAGAGARGAYEAGALAVLLPALEALDRSPGVFVGTSAGAINATLMAASAHRPAAETAATLVKFWSELGCHDIWRPLVRSAPGLAVRYTADTLGFARPRLTSLLDSAPMRATAASWGPVLDRAHDNVRHGIVEALAVVATDVYRGRSVVFADLADHVALPSPDLRRQLHYVAAAIRDVHVLASAAIPLAFPAIRIDEPGTEGGWFIDGGVRLNAPLKPALALGATDLVVVATHPVDEPAHPEPDLPSESPEVDDQLVHVLEAVLVDRMVEDLHTLRTVNRLVQGADASADGGTTTGHVQVPNAFVGPVRRDVLGRLAEEVYRSELPLRERLVPTSPAADLAILRRALASGEGPRAGDPLSYVFFHPAFARAAITRGRNDAEAAIEAGALDEIRRV